MIYLNGLRISGYRSFAEEIEFSGLSKINILIGQNNSGKSNVLRFLSRHFGPSKEREPPALDSIRDKPKINPNAKTRFSIQIIKNGYILQQIKSIQTGEIKTAAEKTLFKDSDSFWYLFEEAGPRSFQTTKELKLEMINALTPHNGDEWYKLYKIFLQKTGGDINVWKAEILQLLEPTQYLPTRLDLIPATRSLRSYSGKELSHDQTNNRWFNNGIMEHGGIGLIQELFKLQKPTLDKENDKERFNRINEFIRDITGNTSLELEIPHDISGVYVKMDGKRLDIESLGSGIEQMLIIAAKSTLFSKQIVCIEEPEIHLHPTLQRKLIHYLNDKTDNQYFIATHSAHFLDAVPASIYHIKLNNGYSKVTSAIQDKERFIACADLGYKASDLLQANCIIWVEGPSDRIYLNYWIKAVAPYLQEGLHYSIMFYGGRLLKHLSANDEVVEDFIKLQKINRNMCILIDSDRRKKTQRVNDTKKRIECEFRKNNQLVWITAGREIENYLSPALYEEAVKETHKKAKRLAIYGRYEDLTIFWTTNRKIESTRNSIDKLKVAHFIEKQTPDLNVLDLRKRLEKLVEFIHSANLLRV